MVWHRTGAKPLHDPMVTQFPVHHSIWRKYSIKIIYDQWHTCGKSGKCPPISVSAIRHNTTYNPLICTSSVTEPQWHYNGVIMSAMASQITILTIVCSIVYSGADQRKHQSSASMAFGWGIHRWPVNSPHKGPVTRKMFPFDDVIMSNGSEETYQTYLYDYQWRFFTVYINNPKRAEPN